MFGIFKKKDIDYYYQKFVIILDNASGKPTKASDWEVRADVCKNMINNVKHNGIALEALHRIIQESEENAKIKNISNIDEFLSSYVNEKGYDKFIQVGGKYFADEIWFYRNKSKIKVIHNKVTDFYHLCGIGDLVGNYYQHNKDDITYIITLSRKSPEQILIEIEDGNKREDFIIELKRI